MVTLQLTLFGPPQVQRDGRAVRFDTRKATALLALLAVTGREHSRDALAALLWPDLERARARATLRRTLSVAAAAGPALRIARDGVTLDPELVDCDVTEFQRLAAGDAPDDWGRAVALAGDGFLAGFSVRDSPAFEDWQLATADSLRDQLSQLLGRVAAAAVAAGDFAAALDHARRRTRIDPLSEPAHADLIRVTAWSGDRPGALRAYRALVRLLDRELGVPPLPATLALHDLIRAGQLEPPIAPEAAVRTPPARPSAEARPVIAGREAELDQLAAAWHGAGGVCLGLVGEPGMGRSALSSEFAQRCRVAGADAVQLAGRAAEQPLAFAVAGELVRAMLALRPGLIEELGVSGEPLRVLTGRPDGAAGIQSPGDLHRLHEAVLLAVGALAGGRRLLLTVDDAHLLDAPSASLLGYLARRTPAGVLLLATWASGAGGAPLPEAVGEAGQVITLAPLDLAGVAAVLDGLDLDPAEVLRRTRGVPLLVREYAAAGARQADLADPAGVRELVAARLDAAPATTRQLVAAAAAIGTVADPDLLRFACGRDEAETVDAIEDATARGLLVERIDPVGYDLPHDLVRDAALARTSLARQRLLHGRIAEALARRHAVAPLSAPAGAVAGHLARAGRDADAGQWFAAAAAESTRLFAHAEALAQWRAALGLGHQPLAMYEAIGQALVKLGRYDEALVALDQAAALAEGDPPRLAAIEHLVAGVHDRLGDWPLAEAHLTAAHDLLAHGDHPLDEPARHGPGDSAVTDPALLAGVLADLALVQHRQGRAAEAQATARTAQQAVHREHADAAMARVDNVLGLLAEASGDHDQAREHLSQAAERARRHGDLDLEIAALNNLSRSHHQAGDAAAALEVARRALALAERQGDRHRLAALHSHLADLLHAAGREEESLAELKSAATSFAGVDGATARGEVWTLTEW